jgi:SpoVK/Ycf46/Vps4 family AAA+-type ATPase
MTLQLDIVPSAHLPISVVRQEQIFNTINAKLANHPRQGLCLIGSPGTGKTYLMKAIMRRAGEYYRRGMTPTRPLICKMATLAEWQDANLDRVRGGDSGLAEVISPKMIRQIAGDNDMYNRANLPYLHTSLHIFLDEFDSQPTVSEFSSSKLQSLVNACYDNAPRGRPGNGTDFVQFVVAMNKSWSEFESVYGVHVARRIAEMCVRIDFDKEVITPAASPRPAMNSAIDLLIENSAIGAGIDWQGNQDSKSIAQEYASGTRSPIHGPDRVEAIPDDTDYDAQDETQDESQDESQDDD